MKTMGIILVLIVISLQYKLWWGDDGLIPWHSLENKLATQKLENDRLQARNTAMEADIVELKKGDQALEEQARYELGMIKEDETYYQFSQ